MKKNLLICTLPLFMAVLLFAGCETDSASETVSVSPNSISIRRNQSLQFTATGGYQYTWSLENDSWGTLSTRTGSQTVYTSLYDPASNATDRTQTLTVTSTIDGSTSGSNSTPYAVTGQAIITHI